MTFIEILTKVMEERHIKQSELARGCGLTDNAVSKWFKKDGSMKLENAIKVADFLNLSLDELSGRVPLYTEQLVSLPIVGAINAGSFTIESEDDWEGEYHTIPKYNLFGRKPSECVVLEVVGDSMKPLINNGELIIVHRQQTAVNGNIIVAYDSNQGGYTLKIFEQTRDKVYLKPANPEYKTYSYTRPGWDILQIYGICIYSERSFV